MDPAWLFFLTLAALHIVEGLLWVRRDAVAFAKRWHSYTLQRPQGPLGTPKDVLHFVSPLPPLPDTFIVEPWPLVAGREHVWLVPAQRLNHVSSPPQPHPSWTWPEAARTRAEGRKIEGPSGQTVATSSAALATFIVEALHAAAALSPEERQRYIDDRVRGTHDRDAIHTRVDAYRTTTWRLRLYGNLLLPLLFGSAYAVFFITGVVFYWPYLAGCIVALLLLIWVETWRAHRRLSPQLRADRWTAMIMMVASPPAAIRAQAWLARDMLATFNPAAVGAVLLSEPEFEKFAAALWRDLSAPIGPQDPQAADDLHHARQILKAALQHMLDVRSIDAERFEVPPTAEGCIAYCPRCQEVFTTHEGDCADCPGVRKKPLPS